MNESTQKTLDDVAVDTGNLYVENTYTDLKVATIRKLTPVLPDGSKDASREAVFTAQTHIMTRGGPLPIEAPIQASSLEEACRMFPQAVREGMEQLATEMEKRQREQASRLVVPGQDIGLTGGGEQGPLLR